MARMIFLFTFMFTFVLGGQVDRQIEVCASIGSGGDVSREHIQVHNSAGARVATLSHGTCATVGEFSIAGGSAVFFRRQTVEGTDIDVPVDRASLRVSMTGVTKVTLFVDSSATLSVGYE